MDWTILGQQLWTGLVNGGVYVMLASGLSLVFGVMRVINMAHGELSMLGAMVTFSILSVFGWGGSYNFFAAMAIAILVMSVGGVFLNRLGVQPFIGRTPMTVLMSTLALSFIALHGSVGIWSTNPKLIKTPFTMNIADVGGVRLPADQIMLFILGAVAVYALYILLSKIKLGKMMRATSQNTIGSQLVGINTNRVYDFTLVFAAALAALAGILMAPMISAHPFMGQPLLVMGFAVVIVAGMGNLLGALIIGIALGVIEALFGQYVSTYYRTPFIYAIMVIILLSRPQGLFGRR